MKRLSRWDKKAQPITYEFFCPSTLLNRWSKWGNGWNETEVSLLQIHAIHPDGPIRGAPRRGLAFSTRGRRKEGSMNPRQVQPSIEYDAEPDSNFAPNLVATLGQERLFSRVRCTTSTPAFSLAPRTNCKSQRQIAPNQETLRKRAFVDLSKMTYSSYRSRSERHRCEVEFTNFVLELKANASQKQKRG